MAEKKKKNSASFGTLFWIAFILLVLILFVYNKDAIFSGFGKVTSSELFSGNKKIELNGDSSTPVTPQVTSGAETTTVPGETDTKGDGSLEPDTTATVPAPVGTVKTDAAPIEQTTTVTEKTTKTAPQEKQKTAPAAKPEPAKKNPAVTAAEKTAKTKKAVPVEKATPVRTVKLYFVTIDEDGKVIRREVSRDIPQNDSPLSETLQTLFRGPNAAEKAKKMMTCIPAGTKLLSATVKNGIATVNMSDAFQFNQYGIEGYLGELSQIVYTATSFPTVKSVQFLIEGQRREYLGAEGVWIGSPLSRDKFE